MNKRTKGIYSLMIFALVVSLNPSNLFSQVIDEKVLESDPFKYILKSPENELLYIGTQEYPDLYRNDIALAKKDFEGKLIWEKSIEMSFKCVIKDAIALSDGDIIIAGGAKKSTFESVPFAMKTDSKGEVIWLHYYDAGNEAEKIIENYDGGYLFAYYSNGTHLMKLDAQGHSLWSKKVGEGRVHGLTETSEAVFLTVDDHQDDIILTSIGSEGEVMWKLEFGGPGVDKPVAVMNDATNGDNYLFAGTYSSEKTGKDFYISLIDCFGYTKWSKTFGGEGEDVCHNFMQSSNGDFIAVGESNSYSETGNYEFYAVKIDIRGNIIWEKTFPAKENADYQATSVFETSDGVFLLTGTAKDTGFSEEAYFFEFIHPTPFNISFETDQKVFENPPYKVQFTNTTPGAEYYDFVWHFGDGTTLQSNSSTVSYEYQHDGLYDVKLVAYENDFGSLDSAVFKNHINCSAIITSENSGLTGTSNSIIYPNPFSDKATINLNNPDRSSYSIRLINQTGTIVYQQENIRNSSIEIERRGLPPGLYFIELAGKSIIRTKVIIK